MKKRPIVEISLCAAAIALHIILELFLTIRIGNELKLTFCALPFLIIAFLLGPVQGFVAGLVGTFLSQLLTFGITITTVFWILPYAIQALCAGLIFKAFKKKTSIASMTITVFAAGFVGIVITWIASYLDGVVFFKYWTLEASLAVIPMRMLVWLILSAVYSAVCIPLISALRKSVSVQGG